MKSASGTEYEMSVPFTAGGLIEPPGCFQLSGQNTIYRAAAQAASGALRAFFVTPEICPR